MRVIRAVAAIALVAAGCSSDRESTVGTSDGTDDSTVADPLATDVTTTVGETAVSATSPADLAADLPDGAQPVALADLGIAFAAPETYTALMPTELGADFYESDGFLELAERLHIEPDVFGQALRESLAVFLFAPAEAEGYIDNISVSVTPETGLPGDESITGELRPLDATEIAIGAVDVAGAEAMTAAYTRPGGSDALFARDLMVESDGDLITVGVLAATADEAGRVGDLVVDTLRVDR